MTEASKDPSPRAKSWGSRKRWWAYAVALALVLALAGFLLLRGSEPDEADEATPQQAVYKIKRKVEPPRLDIEYHFDRNAIADSRIVGKQLLALTTSGNLLTLDAETFAARNERVLRRRATCLGPADETHVLAGIANGVLVRVSVKDLSIERVGQVPGIPRWIGVRATDGGFVTAYQPERRVDSRVLVADEGHGRTFDAGVRPILFLDSKDRLWIASGDTVRSVDLATGTHKDQLNKGGWAGLRGFVELSDGQIWAFGGSDRPGGLSSFVVRVAPDGKSTPLFTAAAKPRSSAEPRTTITHVLEDLAAGQVIVVLRDNVLVSDRSLSSWKSLDGMSAAGREADALSARGHAHLSEKRVLLGLIRGGVMEVTGEFARRHALTGQYPVSSPSEIVRLSSGMAFYGDGGPAYYVDRAWRPLPDPIMPPAELTGPLRSGESERGWAATTTIPIEGEVSYVITKAGPPRHYIGHIHGLRDVFLTARWDGAVLTVLGREDLPIEPDDTFITPDKQLWNVDDQGLWSFDGGRWRMVMRISPEANAHRGARVAAERGRAGGPSRSSIGDPLRFANTWRSPFYGLPRSSPSWSLVRLDSNEAGGVPLIDEIPVRIDGRRVLLRDLASWGNTKDSLLLATNRGLCSFNIKFGNCDIRRPEGLDGEGRIFMRDGTKRLWLGGQGLWVLRDDKQADPVHPSIPMLSDTDVVALAEMPDGRLVIGTADRGVVFLSIPQGWFQRPADEGTRLELWESTRPHEPLFGDRSVVLQLCAGKTGQLSDEAMGQLITGAREIAARLGGRTRVELEDNYDDRPDVAIRGADPETVLSEARQLLDKPAFRGKLKVHKRFGAPGSESVEVVSCH